MHAEKARISDCHRRLELAVLVAGLVCGAAAFAYYYSAGLTVAHYDAKAHLLVARRLFDSPVPGYVQLGTHWLPLVHLLYLPLVFFDFQYRTGFLPAFVSVIAFALSGWLAFRIARRAADSAPAGLMAAAILLGNANLLYLQSCPLTEPVFMPLMLLALDRFWIWREEGQPRLPWAAGLWASLGALCRYEGWLLVAGMVGLIVYDRLSGRIRTGRAAAAAGVLISLFAVPLAAHFGYQYWRVGDNFLIRVAEGNPAPYETLRRPFLSLAYHLGELGQMAGLIPLLVAAAGVVVCLLDRERLWRRLPLFILWAPSLVNLSALYWGMMYRVRYSALLIPAVAVFAGLAAAGERSARRALTAAALLAALLPWVSWWFPPGWEYHMTRPGPGAHWLPIGAVLLFLAGRATGRHGAALLLLCVLGARLPALEGEDRPILAETLEHGFEEPERSRMIETLRREYDGSRILVDILRQAPLMYDTGLPVREFIYNEGDSGLWQRAMARPALHVGWLVATRNDIIWNLLQIDPGWADGYSLVFRTEAFSLYRRLPAGR